MKKNFFLAIIISLILSGCTSKSVSQPMIDSKSSTSIVEGKCITGPVDIEGYGDKGQRLANCFVQYPGEPSRQDKAYYIVEDICGQFTPEFISNLLGQKIVSTKGPLVSGLYNCSYYLNDKDYVMLILDYLSVENQKKGREFIGHTIKVDENIPMENFYAVQEDGVINTVYLVLNPNKFISIERSSSKVLEGQSVLQFAEKLGSQIKDYK